MLGRLTANPSVIRNTKTSWFCPAEKSAAARLEARVGRTGALERVADPLKRDRIEGHPRVRGGVARAGALDQHVGDLRLRPVEERRGVGHDRRVLPGLDDRVVDAL